MESTFFPSSPGSVNHLSPNIHVLSLQFSEICSFSPSIFCHISLHTHPIVVEAAIPSTVPIKAVRVLEGIYRGYSCGPAMTGAAGGRVGEDGGGAGVSEWQRQRENRVRFLFLTPLILSG